MAVVRGQLPEPFAGWGSGKRVELLVVGENPAFDPDEVIPDQRFDEAAYFEYYWRRFQRQRDKKTGQIVKSMVGGKPDEPIGHYNKVEKMIGSGALGSRALYIDGIPWKGEPGRSGIRGDNACRIARRRIARFLPFVDDGSHRKRIIALGEQACKWISANQGETWKPFSFTWQDIRYEHAALTADIALLTLYHPSVHGGRLGTFYRLAAARAALSTRA